MSQPDQHSKVSVEDLLRLKRAERPSPEFWSNFERELRQKQLTALVQKRRWWHDLPLALNRRFYMPAGAAAIVAFTLVSVRYAVPARMAQVPNTAPQIALADPAVEMLAATEVTDAVRSQAGTLEVPAVIVSGHAAAEARASDVAAVAIPAKVEAASTRSLVANFSRLEQAEPELLVPVIGSQLSAPARVQPASASQSELASMAPAPSADRYQLIARYADRSLSPAPAAPAVVRERLARRLGDDLGDGISRIGVVGNRVSLKF